METITTEFIVDSFLKNNIVYDKPYMGAANGYVIIRKDHPYFNIDIEELNTHIEIHGGLTFGNLGSHCIRWSALNDKYKNDDYCIYGFDTMHHSDNFLTWPLRRVQDETDQLSWQFYMAYIKSKRDDNRNKCRTGICESNGEQG